jgi:AraC-like DNA-binding protein
MDTFHPEASIVENSQSDRKRSDFGKSGPLSGIPGFRTETGQAGIPADGDTDDFRHRLPGHVPITVSQDSDFPERFRHAETAGAYADAEITLRDVSEHLGLSPHNISEVINSRMNQNFYDFINRYRIEKVKKDLLDRSKQHLTILGIAFDAGFNSKSGFNSIFKRFTGRTPGEFRDQSGK